MAQRRKIKHLYTAIIRAGIKPRIACSLCELSEISLETIKRDRTISDPKKRIKRGSPSEIKAGPYL